MRNEMAVSADVLIDSINNNTLAQFFLKYRAMGDTLYIPFGVRRKVEESLDNEEHTRTWHKLLRESLQHGLVEKSRHKYTLEHDYKVFFRGLHKLGEELTMTERELIALSFQLGIDIDTNDEKITRILSEIKTNPSLKKYTLRLSSRKARQKT